MSVHICSRISAHPPSQPQCFPPPSISFSHTECKVGLPSLTAIHSFALSAHFPYLSTFSGIKYSLFASISRAMKTTVCASKAVGPTSAPKIHDGEVDWCLLMSSEILDKYVRACCSTSVTGCSCFQDLLRWLGGVRILKEWMEGDDLLIQLSLQSLSILL